MLSLPDDTQAKTEREAATEDSISVVQYDEKLCHLLDTYDKLFIVHADNVGSKQFQDIRRVSQHTHGTLSA